MEFHSRHSLQYYRFSCNKLKMFLLAVLCVVGTALAAPAIPEAPLLPAESHILVSPYISYSAPIFPLRSLEMLIEPEPKEENEELPEPNEELSEPAEPIPEPEELKVLPVPPEAPELPKLEPAEPVLVKVEIPKPPTFITNWINSLPNINLPDFISNWFPSNSSPPKILYTGFPGAVFVEAAKP